jgi:predicted helicase
MLRMIDFFNQQVQSFAKNASGKSKAELPAFAERFIDTDATKISWSREIKQDLVRGKRGAFRDEALRSSVYRPFTKCYMYFDSQFNNCVYQMPQLFPSDSHYNLAICTTAVGNRVEFSVIMCDLLPDVHMADKNGASQCFPLYLYEREQPSGSTLIDMQEGELIDGYRRTSAVTQAALAAFRDAYEARITEEDIFYYVYGILHSPEYRTRFASDLKKMLPRIPFTQETADFWTFSQAGRDLAEWHLNYENVEPYPLEEHDTLLNFDPSNHYQVQRMTFGRKDKRVDKTTIIYNSHLTLKGIPIEAYDYVVNGNSAIDWIIERYQVTRDRDSGIANDPNAWAREHDQPRYIVDLIKRMVTVSLETIKIVKRLPPLNEKLVASEHAAV